MLEQGEIQCVDDTGHCALAFTLLADVLFFFVMEVSKHLLPVKIYVSNVLLRGAST